MTGKVWLTGAGPSGVELLTIKAKRVIEQADVVVYDALAGDSVLGLIPASAERIYVGKRAGHHTIPQEEINRLLISLAQQGKKVVRLKGGDPFVFGRGGEELEALKKHRIPFEVVPGVTSVTAVPAYFGIPITHREWASSVHIITGHQKKDEPLRINFRALKEAGGTLVFLMGVTSLHAITAGLLEAGMDPEMPAAILQQGAGGRQKKTAGTLGSLEREAEKQGILRPAVIVVGEVVRLGEQYDWFEKLPLFGKRFLVTRPRERAGELSEKLRELGAEAVECPAVTVRGIHPNPALREEIGKLAAYRFLVFTSPAGVREFMQELLDMGKDVRSLHGVSIAAIGSGTEAALRQYGIAADAVPEVYSGRALGALLNEQCRDGDKVLLARSAAGNPELVTELQRGKEIAVTDRAVYTIEEGRGGEMRPALEGGTKSDSAGMEAGSVRTAETVLSCISPGGAWMEIGSADDMEELDGVFFTSGSTVRGFVSMFPGTDFTKVRALCIGEMTAGEAEKYGMQVYTAGSASVESLVELALSL